MFLEMRGIVVCAKPTMANDSIKGFHVILFLAKLLLKID